MANTPMRGNELRKHTHLLPVGTRIGIHHNGGIIEGSIYSHDQGGWIYVTWKSGGVNSFLRSTQVFPL